MTSKIKSIIHICPVPNCLGKQGKLSGNCLPKHSLSDIRFIMSKASISSDSLG